MSDTSFKQVTIRSKDLRAKSFYLPKSMTVRGVKVESMFIPYTFHNVNFKQNKLYLSQRVSLVNLDGFVTVPDGNYTATQFASALQTALNSATVVGWSGTWFVDLNEITGALTIINDSRVFVVKTEGFDSLHELIGFSNPSTTYAQSQTGNGVVNMNPTKVLNLRSTSLGNLLEDVIYSGNTLDNSVLASVWLNSPFGSYAEFRPHTAHYMQLGKGQPITLQSFDIDLVDEDLQPIDFLGSDWYVTLSFI